MLFFLFYFCTLLGKIVTLRMLDIEKYVHQDLKIIYKFGVVV